MKIKYLRMSGSEESKLKSDEKNKDGEKMRQRDGG